MWLTSRKRVQAEVHVMVPAPSSCEVDGLRVRMPEASQQGHAPCQHDQGTNRQHRQQRPPHFRAASGCRSQLQAHRDASQKCLHAARRMLGTLKGSTVIE